MGLTLREDRSVWTRPTPEGEVEGTGVASEEISRVEGVALVIEVGVEELPGGLRVTMPRGSPTKL